MYRLFFVVICFMSMVACSQVAVTTGLQIKPHDGYLARTSEASEWSYYIVNNTRRMIPPAVFDQKYHDAVMKSWGWTEDQIIVVSESILDQMPVIGDVTIRPGTFLVKDADKPQVYEVTALGVKPVPSEKIKADDVVVTCPDVFWWHYFALH